jgi:16S rRNA (guanine(966)-N(2))-methyltransferase RsmD
MAKLRVIAGTAKGRRLKMVPGRGTRPVGDRVKESVFNIMGRGVAGCHFLDLFAGTGSVGIEALSRGAAYACFVEKSRRAVAIIEENLEITGLGDKAEVVQGDVFQVLQSRRGSTFDYVYIAPPQYRGLWLRTLTLLEKRADWVNPDGVVLVQIDPKESQQLTLRRFVEIDRREYGNTAVIFFEKTGSIGESQQHEV